jgi:hypothetical protein
MQIHIPEYGIFRCFILREGRWALYKDDVCLSVCDLASTPNPSVRHTVFFFNPTLETSTQTCRANTVFTISFKTTSTWRNVIYGLIKSRFCGRIQVTVDMRTSCMNVTTIGGESKWPSYLLKDFSSWTLRSLPQHIHENHTLIYTNDTLRIYLSIYLGYLSSYQLTRVHGNKEAIILL